jgi:peroxiredoxin
LIKNSFNMKKFVSLIFMFCALQTILVAQKVIDFKVTDINGKQHKLYEDYLNKGKIVVTYLMYADCPPCNILAPRFQKMFENFSSGKDQVAFMMLSISKVDTLDALKAFSVKHGLTTPLIGPQGGSLTANIQFINARFGPYQYVPQFSIILPNGDVVFDIVISRLEQRINEAITGLSTLPNKVKINYSIPLTESQNMPSNSSFFLKSSKDLTYKKNITQLLKGSTTFEYPSSLLPEVESPFISFESSESTPRGIIGINDVIALRKQVLRMDTLSADAMIAADINNDGRVTLSDIVAMQRFILGIDRVFPDRPSIIMHPATIPIEIKGSAQNVTFQPKLIWVGNVAN